MRAVKSWSQFFGLYLSKNACIRVRVSPRYAKKVLIQTELTGKLGLRRLLNRFQNFVFVTAYKTFTFDLDNLVYTCVLLAYGIGIVIQRQVLM